MGTFAFYDFYCRNSRPERGETSLSICCRKEVEIVVCVNMYENLNIVYNGDLAF